MIRPHAYHLKNIPVYANDPGMSWRTQKVVQVLLNINSVLLFPSSFFFANNKKVCIWGAGAELPTGPITKYVHYTCVSLLDLLIFLVSLDPPLVTSGSSEMVLFIFRAVGKMVQYVSYGSTTRSLYF